MRRDGLRTDDVDPMQPWLEGMPSRYSELDFKVIMEHLEMVLQDSAVPPFIQPGSLEEEQVLKEHTQPEAYTRAARIRAFLPIGPDGKRPKRFTNKKGEPATGSEILIQEIEVCEVTILRLGKKMSTLMVNAEKFAGHFDLDPERVDSDGEMASRAERVTASLFADTPVPFVYEAFNNFINFAGLHSGSKGPEFIDSMLLEPFQSGDARRITRLCQLVLIHELKRAAHFQLMHTAFANYRLKRQPVWNRIDPDVLKGVMAEMYSIPLHVRDETVEGKKRYESWLQKTAEEQAMPRQQLEPQLQPVSLADDTLFTSIRGLVRQSLNNDRVEEVWRVGIASIRKFGKFIAQFFTQE